MTSKPFITSERLREVLDYDPDTGIFTWKVRTSNRISVGDPAGSKGHEGYIIISVDAVRYGAHRLAWLYMSGTFPCDEIDHKNLKRADNRFDNLREATRIQNGRNLPVRKNNTSGHIGVSWDASRDKWQVTIRINGRSTSLGRFNDLSEAALAYAKASRKHFGEFSPV